MLIYFLKIIILLKHNLFTHASDSAFSERIHSFKKVCGDVKGKDILISERCFSK